LTIPEKYQKHRYAKISQLLGADQCCRYFGETTGFVPDTTTLIGSTGLFAL
jgi:hypothetical protein